MKKKYRRYFHYLFWAVIVLGGLWIGFAPRHTPQHHKPHQVDVAQLPEPKAEVPQPQVGDEVSQSPSVTVPVAPVVEPKPAIIPTGKPRIAIVIDDVGLDMAGSRRAVVLPAFVTLSYIPYSTRIHEQTRDARDAGHELLLHMPMEPVGSADPGPGALLTGLSDDELRRRLVIALASFTGFDGMNNHMGSKFTSDKAGMELVVDELLQRHIFFLDSRTSTQTVGASIAKQRGLPTVSRDVFLDDDMSAKAVRAQLLQTEHIAQHKGYAIAIGHPHAVTLQALEEWLPDAQKRGFVFVPINTLVSQ